MVPEIKKIESFSSPSSIYVGAALSAELLPGCGYLMLTHLKWPYWLGADLQHLLCDRTIDNCHGFSVNKRRYHAGHVEREWLRQKTCWLPLLKWAEEHARQTTVRVRRFSLSFVWLHWPASGIDEKTIADQLYALVARVRELQH